MQETICKKCGESVRVDGDYPKFFAWCDTCGDYAKGYNPVDTTSDMIDQVMMRRKDERRSS